jgi:hypothetical protein
LTDGLRSSGLSPHSLRCDSRRWTGVYAISFLLIAVASGDGYSFDRLNPASGAIGRDR